MPEISYTNREKLRAIFILIIFLILLVSFFTDIGKKIIPALSISTILLLVLAIYLKILPTGTISPKRKFKEILQETAQELNLEIKKADGWDRFIVPVWAMYVASGEYKNFHIKIIPTGSSLDIIYLLFLKHTEASITIEISSPFVFPENSIIIKNDFKARYIELPPLLENMSYYFESNRIAIEGNNKLVVSTEDKIPTSDDIVLIIEELIKIAENLNKKI